MSLVLAAARRVAGAGHGGATERSTGRRAVFTESTTEKWPRYTSRLRFLARAGSRGIASGPAWWRAEQTHFFFGYSPPAWATGTSATAARSRAGGYSVIRHAILTPWAGGSASKI